MNTSLLNILIQTIKARTASLVTKLRLWTSWTYIRSRVVVKIRDFFYNLLGVKPRNKDDYYTVFGWMISRRLVIAAVIMVGVVSLWYITTETNLFTRFDENGIRTYKYDSFRLRTAEGRVRILGRSGYLAYDGNVDKGYAKGEGTLYNPAGQVVYAGSFDNSKYEGQGVLNYENGVMRYRGQFHDNLFEGTGTYFREDGTRNYEGDFFQGYFNGSGVLYDSGENELYVGSFSSNSIVYSELLGKTAAETQEYYKGGRELYYSGSESVVVMRSIGALCHLVGDEDAVNDSEVVDGVYVLQNRFRYGDADIDSITDLRDVLGTPVYEGNSGVLLPEAIAINLMSERRQVLSGRVDMEVSRPFSDAAEVVSFDRDYVVYLYTFRRGDLLYSFVCQPNGDRFAFYYVASAGDELG